MFPVSRRLFIALSFTLFVLPLALPSGAAIVDPKLQAAMQGAAPTELIQAIVTYKAQPTALDVAALSGIGVKTGLTLKTLPMIGVFATSAQLQKISQLGTVRSLYLNSKLKYFNREATALVSAKQQRSMAGFGYTGKGVGVAVIDSGVDGTHPDLMLGQNLKQNAKMLINGADIGSDWNGIIPPVWVEGVPDTDITCGHGTHCAGTVGGTGAQSGGKYAGVAPGADLVGVSTGESIVVLWALAGWDYTIQHRAQYKIRVVSNSWGSSGEFDPEDPINVASKTMHDLGMVVVFAAGNAGPGSNTLNPYSVAPWVIGVAASDKKVKLASFSSRGLKNDPLYHPTVCAPGVSLVSTKAKGTAIGAVSGDIVDDPNLPAEEIPWYCHLSGTSMACPVISGCAALLLEANPNLTPHQIKNILRTTATRMAGYSEFEVGAGHVNVLAALHMAKTGKAYGDVLNQAFTAKFDGYQTVDKFDQAWDPTLAPPRHDYTVAASALQTDIFITWDSDANTFNLAATDPNGTRTSTGSNLLWELDGLSASLSFLNPVPGNWFTTIYGLRGESSGTTGIGVPDVVHGTIINYYGSFGGMTDIDGSPYASYIRRAVTMRLMDSFSDATFKPTAAMTRSMAAKTIATACDVRQNLLNPMPYSDVTGTLVSFVSAVTAPGGPMRDTFSEYGPIMQGATATKFGINEKVTRAEMATWLVRALGLEADAQANMTTATTYTDDAQIPAAARGYVVVASSLGLMGGYVNAGTIPGDPPSYSWKPANNVLRGEMAMTICRWYDIFMQ
jgi:serine protease AprX